MVEVVVGYFGNWYIKSCNKWGENECCCVVDVVGGVFIYFNFFNGRKINCFIGVYYCYC